MLLVSSDANRTSLCATPATKSHAGQPMVTTPIPVIRMANAGTYGNHA
jgi:hypothetical protein